MWYGKMIAYKNLWSLPISPTHRFLGFYNCRNVSTLWLFQMFHLICCRISYRHHNLTTAWYQAWYYAAIPPHNIYLNLIISVTEILYCITEIPVFAVIHNSMVAWLSDENSDGNDNYRILVRIEENHNIWWEFRNPESCSDWWRWRCWVKGLPLISVGSEANSQAKDKLKGCK